MRPAKVTDGAAFAGNAWADTILLPTHRTNPDGTQGTVIDWSGSVFTVDTPNVPTGVTVTVTPTLGASPPTVTLSMSETITSLLGGVFRWYLRESVVYGGDVVLWRLIRVGVEGGQVASGADGVIQLTVPTSGDVIATVLPESAVDATTVAALAAEVSARQAADTSEASTRAAADTVNANAITAETTRATTAEATKVPTSRLVAGHPLTSDVTLVKGDVGLGNVDNTSDANKPVSSATSAAITAAVNGLLNGAPGALDTLKELADALGDDASFATTVTNALALKAPVSTTTIDLVDRTNNATETVPAGTTTNCSTAGVTKTAPALDNPVGTPPKRFSIKNLSAGNITVAYPDQSGAAQSLVVLPAETRTFRQKSTSGWGVESGAIAVATLDARFAPTPSSQSAPSAPNPLSGYFHPESYAGADYGAQIAAAVTAAKNYGGGTVYAGPGTHLCNTPVSYGAGTALIDLPASVGVKLKGCGLATILRTTTATATEFIRLDAATNGAVEDLWVQVAGTAFITRGVHLTTPSPGSSHRNAVRDVFVSNEGAGPLTSVVAGAPYTDGALVNGSPWVSSVSAAFVSADVGASLVVSTGNSYILDTVQAVRTLTGTLAADVTAGATTITLTGAITNQPTAAHSLLIGSETVAVTAGFGTTTLTVSRGYNATTAAAHTAGAALTVTQAQIVSNSTITASAQVLGVNRVLGGVSQRATLLEAFAAGRDHAGASNLDLAGVNFVECAASRAMLAGFAVGNGTTGNVLDLWARGCAVDGCTYAVLGEGSILNGSDWSLSGNGVDFKVTHIVPQQFRQNSARSENCGRILEAVGLGSSAATYTFSDYICPQFWAADGCMVQATGSAGNYNFLGCTVETAITMSSFLNISGASANIPAMVTLVGSSFPSSFSCPLDGSTAIVLEVNGSTNFTSGTTVPSTSPFQKVGTDPLGHGIVETQGAGGAMLSAVVANANRTNYVRGVGSSRSISNIEIHVVTASGNICVALLTGPRGKANPTAVLASSGSVACPAAGYAAVALGATVGVWTPYVWFSFGADNTTAAFLTEMMSSARTDVSTLALGAYAQDTVFPQASPPSGLTTRYCGQVPKMRAV